MIAEQGFLERGGKASHNLLISTFLPYKAPVVRSSELHGSRASGMPVNLTAVTR
jgi:hypothetical protein